MKRRILVVGGAGYIGGVTAHLFCEQGYRVTVFDNLSTGKKSNLPKGARLVEGDITKPAQSRDLFNRFQFDLVLHFAGKIRVDESVVKPAFYFKNNITGSMNLVDALVKSQPGVPIVFSSSAAVYGQTKQVPIKEDAPCHPLSPYGFSKLMVEQVLTSYEQSHGLNWVALRYFNPVGAYAGVGSDYPFRTHLVPVAIAAMQTGRPFEVFGNDYPTPDGTCIRDYIHVLDAARAHLDVAKVLLAKKTLDRAINLGSGHGYSVLEIIKTLEQVGGQPVPYQLAPRRPGDSARLIASNGLAKKLIGWKPKLALKRMLNDQLQWQK